MIKVKKSKLPIEKISKIYHISDVHIRNYKRHEEYKRVFDSLYKYLKNEVQNNDLICLTGDIVHSKTDVSPELFHETQDFFKSLSQIAPVLLIPGNHDANLNNSHRMDSLTPIVNALNDTNFEYLKHSGVWEIGGVNFYHWSVFDDKKKYIKPTKLGENTSICLFHGAVNNATSETGFLLKNDFVNVQDFENFDLVLLGDIHKRQYLNESKSIAYPGSLIQQNHGEDLVHGIMVWDVNTKESQFVDIPNDTAFYTIDVNLGVYNPLPDNLQKNLYLRIKYKNTDQATIKSILNEIKKDRNIIELSLQKVQDFSKSDSSAGNFTNKFIDIRSSYEQRHLLKDFLSLKYELTDADYEKIFLINDEVNANLVKNEVPRNSMWNLKRFEFDNMFSYGKGNYVDFNSMEGTYGLFAPNASGKSTLFDSLTYCIFDKCTKTNRGHQVMNSSSNSFYCKLNFELHGINYFIERNARRQKSGNVRVEVDFYSVDDHGNKISHNGKERTDTNNNIKALLGNYEDFILTTLSTQTNNTGFIDMNQKERKELLSQFLDIGIFEEMFNIANESSKENLTLLKHHQKTNYELEFEKYSNAYDQCSLSLQQKQSDLTGLLIERDSINKKIVDLATKLQKVDATLVDENKLKEKHSRLVDELEDFVTKKSIILSNIDEYEREIKTLENNLVLLNELDLDNREHNFNNIQHQFNELKLKKNELETHVKHQLSKMENLKELEYDPNCYYCMNNIFVKDAIQTKDKLSKDQDELLQVTAHIAKLEESIKDDQESIKKNRKALNTAKESISNYQKKLVLSKTALSEVQANIVQTTRAIDDVVSKINQREEQHFIIENNSKIDTSIEVAKIKLNVYETTITNVQRELTELQVKIKISESNMDNYKKLISERKELENKQKYFEYYLNAVHRDGIPHNLITKTIPQIEEEVNNILSQLVDFKIILQTDDKNVNAYIAYSEEEFWPLELTSGMEKFVSSLAIRTALIGVSTLPRPNFIAIDEGFGALDKANLNSMSMLFDYLKTQFKFIAIISHIDSMRDIVDSHIEINKVNGRSSVKY